ncbi:hypothetical protein E2C01_017471 [Portunus trituberculatus]|uniref:Uncharacterized protein n=1 Tax=Portunus trituberculatus TaxID=210409 RepID=A0A5B7DSJ5_PORTR|nr:hypothetical protein [Portunus trituberculatus]
MKPTIPPLRAKKTGNEGAALRVSSSSGSSHGCSSDCSTCYKMTRSGVRYGNRCSHSERRKAKKENQVKKPTDIKIVLPEVRKAIVVLSVSMVVVLLVVVGVALIIHFGKVSSELGKSRSPEKNGEVRRWKLFSSAKETSQPAANPSLDKTQPFLKLFKRGGRTIVEPEPPRGLHKILSALRLTNIGENNVSEEHKLINLSQGHALLSIGVFNLAITALVLLLVP